MSILKITVPYSHFNISAEGNNLIISVQYPYQLLEHEPLIELLPTDDEMPELSKTLNLPLPVPKTEIVDASNYKLPRGTMYEINKMKVDDMLSRLQIRQSRFTDPHMSVDKAMQKRKQVYHVNTGKSTINTIGVIHFQYKTGEYTENSLIADLRRYLIEAPRKIDIIKDGDHYDVFLVYDDKEAIKSQLFHLEYEKESETSRGYEDITHLKSLTIYDEIPPDVLVFTFNIASPLLESAVNSLIQYISSITNNIIKILTTTSQVYIFFSNPQDAERIKRMSPIRLENGIIATASKNERY